TLVNRLAQTSEAIVHEQSGVTRDRSYHQADWNGRNFMLVDTGGLELSSSDDFQTSIKNQALVACAEADLVILMVDAQSGLTADDAAVAQLIKRSGRPVLLVVNKLDDPQHEEDLWQFYQLGLGEPWPLSSLHGLGTGDLLDTLVALLPPQPAAEVAAAASGEGWAGSGSAAEHAEIRMAIIGRPNAGKSTLTNRLLGQERSITSATAGTTRDAIDTVLELNNQRYRIIDTAGIRRKSKIDDDVEYYGFLRALRAIERADVALLLIDAALGLTDQDQHVARLAAERSCALIILINKWDLLTSLEEREALQELLRERLPFVAYAPILPIAALSGRGVQRIWPQIDLVYANYCATFSTPRLNNLLTELREFGHTVSKGRQHLRLHYVTQTGRRPPTFTFFANQPQLVDDNFQRYLENRLRAALPLVGTPIRLKFKKRN
ncbi:MAG: ribosome biogenesis GTPase Der, partial [Actinomycetia bacterium]|nr:ribosome biogenesis GTPase Der [Actinomycetes bacterium]